MPGSHRVFILLGSNIAPEENLPRAVQALASLGRLGGTSSVWESAPVGDTAQAEFCNAAVLLETAHTPGELKQALREIERRLGRVRDPGNKNAARTIDLDIALFDDLVWESDGLQIPDPEIAARPFLAVPLAELDGDTQHPASQKPLKIIAAEAGGTASLRLKLELTQAIAFVAAIPEN